MDGSISADTLKFVFLQNTQESDLSLGRKLADLIEEDRASFSQFRAAQTLLSCARKGALLMGYEQVPCDAADRLNAIRGQNRCRSMHVIDG
jgi:hypothetical protein